MLQLLLPPAVRFAEAPPAEEISFPAGRLFEFVKLPFAFISTVPSAQILTSDGETLTSDGEALTW